MAQAPSKARYDAENTKVITIKLNKKTDAEILERLSKEESVQGFIKSCIKERIERE